MTPTIKIEPVTSPTSVGSFYYDDLRGEGFSVEVYGLEVGPTDWIAKHCNLVRFKDVIPEGMTHYGGYKWVMKGAVCAAPPPGTVYPTQPPSEAPNGAQDANAAGSRPRKRRRPRPTLDEPGPKKRRRPRPTL